MFLRCVYISLIMIVLPLTAVGDSNGDGARINLEKPKAELYKKCSLSPTKNSHLTVTFPKRMSDDLKNSEAMLFSFLEDDKFHTQWCCCNGCCGYAIDCRLIPGCPHC